MVKFSWGQNISKGIKYLVIFVIPVLVDRFIVAYPEWSELPLGALLVMLVNYLKIKQGFRIV